MKVQVINKSNNDLPKYESKLAAGMDVRADFSHISPENPIKLFGSGSFDFKTSILKIDPGSRALIPTGLYTGIPEGYEIQVRPRSGLSLKKGLTCANCVGTIDADFRGQIGVIIINLGLEPAFIENGERIAQFILNKVETIEWEIVDKLTGEDRGGGFGHSGIK